MAITRGSERSKRTFEVGEQKTRNYKNGKSQIFTYYHCSRQVDRQCKELFSTEENVVEQLAEMCNELISDIRNVEPSLQSSIHRFSKMMSITHSENDQNTVLDAYIKYVLKNGSIFEKTRLVRNLDVKLVLHNRKLLMAS
jgi:hypothetical protein